MISISFTRTILRHLLGAGLVCTAFALGTNAQVETRKEVSNGPATQEVKVERGVVVYASGNEVVIKGEDGKIRDFPNVPESARVTVDGQQLSVHDVRPGMTIERTTITTTTPRIITTVKTVTGTVWKITPPTSVILTMESGRNQQFRIPQGTQFTVDGQPTDAFALRPGMKVSATAVTEVPETVVATEVTRTGEPPPVEALDPHIALLIILVPYDASADTTAADSSESATDIDTDAAAAAPAEEAPAQLPKTGSSLPLVAVLGGLLCSLAFGLKAKRAFSS